MADKEPRRPEGFAIFIATIALLLSMGAILAVAFKLHDNGTATTASQVAKPMGMGANEEVKIVVKSDEEHAKMGSDGKWHDAFLPADFKVSPGTMVTVVVLNYDEGEHTFTSNALGTNETIPPGSELQPSETHFYFRAPSKAGRYAWYCALPCDPWAMTHNGYMRGFVTVT